MFIWWFLLVALILYFPMFLFFWHRFTISPLGWSCVFATGILHTFYFLFLSGAYERGDLSLIYPLCRGSVPLFVPFLAVILINERLSSLGILRIALVIMGIYIIHLRSFSGNHFLSHSWQLKGEALSERSVPVAQLLPIR